MRHCEDSDPTMPIPSYLINMFNNVDGVISANWDTLGERTLMKLNKWYPRDGYGFLIPIRKKLLHKHEDITFPNSIVKVLKLHGSVGWREFSVTGVYLLYSSFLQYLKPDNISIIDANGSQSGPETNSIMLYPSYLKQLNNQILLSIWSQAQRILRHAEQVTIVGYSLPSADIGIKILLNELNTNTSCQVTIVDPSTLAKEKWVEFFGNKKIEIVEKTALNYFK